MRIGTGHVIREVGFVHNCACPGPGPWSQSDSRAPLLPRPDVRLRAHVGGERGLSSARGRRPKHCDGNPSHPAGRESNNLPPGPTRSSGEGSATDAVAGACSYAGAIVISGAAPGTTCGNHRADYPRHLRAPSGMVFAVQMHELARKAGRNPYVIPPYKRGVRRFESYCAHQVRSSFRNVALAAKSKRRAKGLSPETSRDPGRAGRAAFHAHSLQITRNCLERAIPHAKSRIWCAGTSSTHGSSLASSQRGAVGGRSRS